MMQEYNLDISFNTDVGDFDIVNDEIPLINSKRKYILSYAREVLKTNKNDIFYLPTFGASLFDFIGKGIDESLVKEIKLRVIDSLVEFGVVTRDMLDVYTGVLSNTLYINIKYINMGEDDFSTSITVTNQGEITIE